MIVDRSIIFWMLTNYWMCWIDKFERVQQIEIIDSLLCVRELKMIRSRDRSSRAENRRRLTKNVKNLHTDLKMKNHTDMKMNDHIDMKMKEVTSTARKRAIENSTLRQLSEFERVQMKTMMSNEMNSETALAVHRADSVSNKERKRDRERDKERERSRERERRERKQAVSK